MTPVTNRAPLSAEEAAVRARGILLILLAVFFFACLDASAKFLSHTIPALEIAWVRYLVNLVLALVAFRSWRHWRDYATKRPWLQFWRAMALLGSTIFSFTAVRYLPLAVSSSVQFAGPLLATALAGPLLGEWPGPRRWAAVIAGFIGVLVVIQPDSSAFNPATLLPLGSAFCYALYSLATRTLAYTDSTSGLAIYAAGLAAVALTPTLPLVAVAPPSWLIAVILIGTGFFGGLGHWFLIMAHRDAPPTVLAPFNYTQLIWATALGYVVFGDIPGPATLIGAAMIVLSGLYALYRERIRRDR
jgi:drug/metabolite transporter (DMT)-like permease